MLGGLIRLIVGCGWCWLVVIRGFLFAIAVGGCFFGGWIGVIICL